MIPQIGSYLHDFCSALWLVSLLGAWLTYRWASRHRESSEARDLAARLYQGLTILFWFSLAGTLAFGVGRAILYYRQEWQQNLDDWRLGVLAVKHAILTIAVIGGVWFRARWQKEVGVAPAVDSDSHIARPTEKWLFVAALILGISAAATAVTSYLLPNEGVYKGRWGSEIPVPAGTEVHFKDLSPHCFVDGKTGRTLAELEYEMGKGKHGWNIPCDTCRYGTLDEPVESWEVGNQVFIRFRGQRVILKVGMDLHGDQLEMVIDPGTPHEVDGGWLNTCTSIGIDEKYPPDRLPEKRLERRRPGLPERRMLDLSERYAQSFVIADELYPGLHVLRITHTWSEERDPDGDDFNHLISIRIE